MRSKQKSAFEAGIMSMTGYLASISKSTESIDKLVQDKFSSLSGTAANKTNSTKIFDSIRKYQSIGNTILRDIRLYNFGIFDTLMGLSDKFNLFYQKFKSDNSPNNRNKNKSETPASFAQLIQNIQTLDIGLSSITKSIESLSNIKLSDANKFMNKLFTKDSLRNFSGFIKSFGELNKHLSVTEKYLPVLKSIQNFNGKLVIEDKQGSKKMPFLVTMGLGLTILAGGLVAMNYVNWGSIFKLTTFIVALGAALAVFLKLGGKGSKIDTSSLKSSAVGLFQHHMTVNRGAELMNSIGYGVLIISIALMALKGVDWKLTAALGGFIIGLTMALTLYSYASNKKIIGGKRAMPPMFALSVGLAFLVLAIAAAGEINWNGVMPLLSFIVALGVSLALMNKLSNAGSGKNKLAFGGFSGTGFIGFAIGLAILTLTIDAFNEITWKGAFALIGFIVALGFAMRASQGKSGSAFKSSGMFGFAMGLAIIVLTIDAMNEVSWMSAFKLIGFIVALGFALRAMPKGMWAGTKGALSSISFGLLLFSANLWLISKMNIDPLRIGIILGLLVVTSLAIHGFNKLLTTKQAGMFLLNSLTISAALLVLGVGLSFASGTGSTIGSGIIKFMMGSLLIYASVVLPLSTLSVIKSGRFVITSLAITAGLLVLGFGLLYGSGVGSALGTGLIKFTLSAVAMLPIILLFSKIKDADLVKFPIVGLTISLGLILLGFGLLTASKFGNQISISGFGNVLIGSAISVAVLMLMSKISLVSAIKFVLVSVTMGLGIFLLAHSIKLVSNTEVNLANIGWFALGVTIFTGIFFLLGLAIPFIAVGIVGAMLMGAGLILIKYAIDSINSIDVQTDKIQSVSDGLISICLMFTKATIYVIPALITATLMIPVLFVSIIAGGLLMMLSMISVNTASLENFKLGIKEIAGAYNQFGVVEAAKILVKAVALTPTILLSVISASVLSMISNIELKQKNYDTFKSGVKLIVGSFNQFGLAESAKAGVKSLALLPVMLAGLSAAYILEKISKIELNQNQMDSFAGNIDLLVDTMVNAINRSQSKLEEAGPGIEALAKLTGVGTNLVDIMIAMANGTYTEYEVKDGKIVPKAVKQIDYNDLSKRIGGSFANLIMGLTESLNAIDDSKSTWKLGGITITNPFKGKNDSKLAAIEKLGNAFLPLTDIIKNLSDIELFKNNDFLNNFNTGLGTLIKSVVDSMQLLNDTKFDAIDANITRLGNLTTNIDKLQKMQFDKYNNGISVFMGNLSDEGRWNRITKNIDKTGTSISKIVKTVNSIDLEKAKTLEKTLQYMSQKNDSRNLIAVLNKICDMIGSLRITQDEGLQKIMQILESGIVPNMTGNSGNGSGNSGSSGSNSENSEGTDGAGNNLQKPKTEAEMLRERAIPVIIVNDASQPVPVDDVENGIGKALGSWNKNLSGGLK